MFLRKKDSGLAAGKAGAAFFMDEKERREVLEEVDFTKLDTLSGPLLGMDEDTELACCPKKSLGLNDHKAVCGCAGSGKTHVHAVADLKYALKKGESFIINDPFGWAYKEYKELCEAEGYRTAVYNLRSLPVSDTVDFMEAMTDAEGDKDVEYMNVQAFARAVIENTRSTSMGEYDLFWRDNRKALLAAAIYYVMYDEAKSGMGTLSNVWDILRSYGEKREYWDKVFGNLEDGHPAKAMHKVWMHTEEAVKTEAYKALIECLSPLMLSDAARITDNYGINLTLPAKEKCAYFVIPPETKKGLNALSAAFFTMAILREKRYLVTLPEGEKAVPVRFILDDIEAAGYIPVLETALKWTDGKMKVTATFCNYGSFMDLYTEAEADSLLEYFDTHIYLGHWEGETTRRFFERKLGTSAKSSETEEKAARDELFGIGKEEEVVLLKGKRPLKLEKQFM